MHIDIKRLQYLWAYLFLFLSVFSECMLLIYNLPNYLTSFWKCFSLSLFQFFVYAWFSFSCPISLSLSSLLAVYMCLSVCFFFFFFSFVVSTETIYTIMHTYTLCLAFRLVICVTKHGLWQKHTKNKNKTQQQTMLTACSLIPSHLFFVRSFLLYFFPFVRMWMCVYVCALIYMNTFVYIFRICFFSSSNRKLYIKNKLVLERDCVFLVWSFIMNVVSQI